ncbi:transcription factor EGL1-like isoform X2 [Arachis ipaensis]|uniref:transcription factor EGL1-like isoform X2 n=1 Tax=Arachis ipaensis TaxID=130454 RepID=UPI000A2B5BD8|nr:transcription factor EGL1-like isoform X2 [Arachis ipaensis]XP_025646474.1 transcription factor EGL1 isoform X2 [Arachis hypogaea]
MLLENFKEHLALSVRSIQWSYAIFWSTSSTQPGVLSWGEGYYNGDIKTRKTSQGVELNFDQIGLQRSEQLRELYKSLKAVEASPQTKRRSAALSPEDLTDTECEEAGWDVELKARGINNKHTLAYQSRVDPVQWLKPYTDETLVELGQKGVRSLLAVPVSFVSEHIETLEEIDMEYREFGRCM